MPLVHCHLSVPYVESFFVLGKLMSQHGTWICRTKVTAVLEKQGKGRTPAFSSCSPLPRGLGQSPCGSSRREVRLLEAASSWSCSAPAGPSSASSTYRPCPPRASGGAWFPLPWWHPPSPTHPALNERLWFSFLPPVPCLVLPQGLTQPELVGLLFPPDYLFFFLSFFFIITCLQHTLIVFLVGRWCSKWCI